MVDLLTHVEKILRELGVTGQPVVVGVSGGPDSLALLHLLSRARDALGLTVHAVHVNHLIRGAEADTDAQFVVETSAEWGVPCRIERVDVPALAAERKLSEEEAARQARYTILGQAAQAVGAAVIAVAHNADDQAETVLMHLLRGAGLAGLRGMLPAAPLSDYHLLAPIDAPITLIRPLLDVPRAEIEAYCAAHGLNPRFDRSNLDTTYFRNQLRHSIIPRLEQVNPNLRQTLTRTASVLAADYEVVQAQTDAAWRAVMLEASADRVRLDLARWRDLPLALQRSTIRRAVNHLRSLRDVNYEHVEAAVDVALHGETGAEATLPAGLVLRVGYDALLIGSAEARPPRPEGPLLPPGSRLDVGEGATTLPGGAWQFSLSRYTGPRSGPAWDALLADRWAAPLDAAKLTPPLVLRTRQPGDRFQPMGVGGTKKISDFMIDQKIPAAWRDAVPLLADAEGIVWVCGWRVDERAEVTDQTGEVWLARFSQFG